MIIAIFISSGCGLRYGKKDTTKPAIGVPLSEVDKLLAQIEQKNAEVTTFKGVGRIKFRRQGKLHISRGLWAGIKPDKFRMEILNPARQPAASIVSDGKWLYLLSYSSGQFHKESTDNADLSKFISTPVRISDIITLLSDGIPLHSYHEAFLKPDSSGTGYIIVLKKRWRGVIEKIYLDEKKTDVRQVEIYNLNGLVYRVSLYRNRHKNKQSADGFRLPPGYDKAIVITNRDGPVLQIDVDKYWVNIPVSTAIFVLNPPSAED
ncbi:outer membrane lipoprotein carrier protein LolA [Desulfococcaceae bacterium HSG9]|nr:outer membrane lipoprotein carrier protein LolA [Desulfococcaceae bacterium HSG9]